MKIQNQDIIILTKKIQNINWIEGKSIKTNNNATLELY